MYSGLGVGLRVGSSTAKWSSKFLRSITTNTMTSLLRGLIGSGGQAEEPTGVETVRTSLLNYVYRKLERNSNNECKI